MFDALTDESNRSITERKLRATCVCAADTGVRQPVQRIVDALVARNMHNRRG